MKIVISTLFILSFISVFAQISDVTINCTLSDSKLTETSGLIYYNSKIITHGDSGGVAELYEISDVDCSITRTITITGATNVDWEDIAQDNTYIYIGDFGNNLGSRTDLVIYRITKTDFSDDNSATAEAINFEYDTQTVFPDTNFDAEGFISFGGKLIIFSKQWVDEEVSAFSLNKTPVDEASEHSAIEQSTIYDVNGLVTGADISDDENYIYLSGYSSTGTPFVSIIYNITANDDDVLSNSKYDFNPILLEALNIAQIEGISFVSKTEPNHTLYISNEYLNALSVAKLRTLNINMGTLSVDENFVNVFKIYPNPFSNKIYFEELVDRVVVYNSQGKIILDKKSCIEIDTESLSSGIYLIRIVKGEKVFSDKMVKI